MVNKDDEFRELLRATDKLKKLLALARDNPNPHEAEAAMEQARRLARKHSIDIATLKIDVKAMPPPTGAFSSFAGAFKRSYPGEDTEDYSKYGKKD